MELVWFNSKNAARERGLLIYNDICINPPGKPFGVGVRLQFFETDGFNSRIYAFENDAGAGYSVNAAYHKGLRYYFNIDIDLKMPRPATSPRQGLYAKLYLRWAQTINQMKSGPASQVDSTPTGSVYKIQVIFYKN
jgi:hypothetical protein